MRRDVLTVENIPFDVSDPEAGELAAPSFYEKWQDVIQPVLKYVALLFSSFWPTSSCSGPFRNG